ncbi:hypothetical protein Patl1_07383 [Pistacia atlantica]|uniref:Uncharacterized protein n=1 Tax=Pistacia atlantica TaxID=434234 RepID=A0ACC1AG02_9ROSI|nr:hypothetical protein Patl1_07383 [Pistacia atlantica]
MVGLKEFFYDQVPTELRSIGLSLYLGILGVGSFLSSFLISVIEKATGGDGHESWFADNLNKAHLDYFYWLLAGLTAAGLISFWIFAKQILVFLTAACVGTGLVDFINYVTFAIGQGEHKPCVQAVCADQFASLFAFLILFYIQDNLNLALGFGIPCISMAFALLVFLLGTNTYPYSINLGDKKNPFVRIGQEAHGILAPQEYFDNTGSSIKHCLHGYTTPDEYGKVLLWNGQFHQASTYQPLHLNPSSPLPLFSPFPFMIVFLFLKQELSLGNRPVSQCFRDQSRDVSTIPMSVYWLIPQYVLAGVADAFTMVVKFQMN